MMNASSTRDARERVVRILGTRAVEQVSVRVSARRLRVLAYHGVSDPIAFAAQLDHIVELYEPVSGEVVSQSLRSRRPLPPRGLWITFDDGSASVIRHALPALLERDVPATLFVCPGLLEDGSAFWWQRVEAALAAGPLRWEDRTWCDSSLVRHL